MALDRAVGDGQWRIIKGRFARSDVRHRQSKQFRRMFQTFRFRSMAIGRMIQPNQPTAR
jgi:hypothetical protein